jgi:hypothetical protein
MNPTPNAEFGSSPVGINSPIGKVPVGAEPWLPGISGSPPGFVVLFPAGNENNGIGEPLGMMSILPAARL